MNVHRHPDFWHFFGDLSVGFQVHWKPLNDKNISVTALLFVSVIHFLGCKATPVHLPHPLLKKIRLEILISVVQLFGQDGAPLILQRIIVVDLHAFIF